MIRISRPDMGEKELEAVREVLEGGQLAQGPKVAEFEAQFARFTGTEHAVAASSGTTAVHMALLAHGVGSGDEVITPSFTFASPINCILLCGARPVFVDIGEDFNIDPARIEAAITPKTKAVMVTHLYGQPADMAAIMEIAERRGLVVIEDACQAHGAEFKGRKVGAFGTGCFSFYATKNMTTGEGGMITTNDAGVAEKVRLLRQHGMAKRYDHEMIGYNYRMSDIEAAIGIVQLARLPELNAQRARNAEALTAGLAGVPGLATPKALPGRRHVWHAYTLKALNGKRDGMVEGLNKAGIEAIVYYPLPVHKQAAYKGMGLSADLPVTGKVSGEIFSVPVHPGLGEGEMKEIAEKIKGFVQ
ncbi:MAG: DegT/DnrJ/EryC1/StrS family aminotransferase [Candidatus Aenigmatarchaeota archaeon]